MAAVVDPDEEWCRLTVNEESIQERVWIVPQVEVERHNFDQGTYCTPVSCESSVEYRFRDPEKKVELVLFDCRHLHTSDYWFFFLLCC